MSFAWRPQRSELWHRLLEAAGRGTITGPPVGARMASSQIRPAARRSYLFASPVGGCRVGFFPDHGLLYAEGRAASFFAGAPAPAELLAPALLGHAATRAALEIEQFGLPLLSEPVVVRRLDLAVELRFNAAADGLRFMQALSALSLPRLKSDVWTRDGRVETIYFRTPERGHPRFRIYDKGVEAKAAPPGTRLRFERQTRYPKAAQIAPETLVATGLGHEWASDLRAWARTDAAVRPADLTGAQATVLRAADEGRLTALAAERLLGWLSLRAEGRGRDWWAGLGQRHIPSRRASELRSLGIALDPSAINRPAASDVVVPMRAFLAAAAAAWEESS